MGYKTDHELGTLVHQALLERGLETPINFVRYDEYDKEEKIELITQHFREIMSVLGLNIDDHSLANTPKRFAKAYINELFKGLDYTQFPRCATFQNKKKNDGSFVFSSNIKVFSMCEHHFVPIDGHASVAYIPRDNVLGLSKLNRIVDFFARRPQLQERLTEQIKVALEVVSQTSDVAVLIEAQHFCVKSRGIGDINTRTTTWSAGGIFNESGSEKVKMFLDMHKM